MKKRATPQPDRTGKTWALAIAIAIAIAIVASPFAIATEARGQDQAAAKPEPVWPGMTRSGTVVLPNGWSLRPAGQQSPLGDFPVLIAEHPREPILAIQHAGHSEHEIMIVSSETGRKLSGVVVPTTFTGMVWSADGKRLFVSGGFDDLVHRYDYLDNALSRRFQYEYPTPGRRAVGGLAISGDGKTIYAVHVFGHGMARFDVESGKLIDEIAFENGSFPYSLTLDESRGLAYVSQWGKAQVAVVNLKTARVQAFWPTQEHPNELLLSPDGQRLYVANANRNTVSVIDPATGRGLETIATAIAPNAPSGSTPNSMALTKDGKVLLVANANTNDLAVINVEEAGKSRPLGFIPTGWYPTSVRIGRDGRSIFVANGKGASSKPNREGPNPLVEGATIREYIGGLFRGTLSRIPFPQPQRMGALTKTVYECSPLKAKLGQTASNAARPTNHPIPAKQGDPSPITHCIYIIKENRTYDQVFGDIKKGNGEPALCLFPEKVTPNHHALVNEFVLLDNFYVESEVSADGHEWTMGAYATDFVEKLWPLSYRGDRRIPYVAEGNFEIAFPSGGYLWDKAKAKGVTYRTYGEFVGDGGTSKIKALEGHIDVKFHGYDLSYPDVKRAERFLEELAEFEAKGEMPRLITLRLPNDHTSGTRPGAKTVTAMVGDNDLALGMVVEGLSKSRFWKNLAIFVVEDDAQNGSDHVDAHRTVALAISPHIKKGTVDSTLYSTSSMLRTIELILGLDPMSQFDAAATPMHASFSDKPDFAPYVKRAANVNLEKVNTATAWGAEKSMKLDLSKEDAADDLIFNEIIWKAVKGADSPMPPPVRAAFVIPSADEDDEEEEDDDDDKKEKGKAGGE